MAERGHRIVPAQESELHDDTDVAGSRITDRFIHERVENVGLDPQAVADRHNLNLADVSHAPAYDHEHPEETRRMERGRDRPVEDHRGRRLPAPTTSTDPSAPGGRSRSTGLLCSISVVYYKY